MSVDSGWQIVGGGEIGLREEEISRARQGRFADETPRLQKEISRLNAARDHDFREFREQIASLHREHAGRIAKLNLCMEDERDEREALRRQLQHAEIALLAAQPPPKLQIPSQETPMTAPLAAAHFTPTTTAISALKYDAETAMWRTSAKTATRLFVEPLSIVLSKRMGGHSDLTAEKIAGFLKTEEGSAIVAFLLGAVPLIAPQVMLKDPRARRLTHEMRVMGLQTVTDRLADELLTPILSTFSTVLAGLPPMAEETVTP